MLMWIHTPLYFPQTYRWQQLSTNKYVGSQILYEITHLLCFTDFCFSFLLPPFKAVGALNLQTSEPVFWAFQGSFSLGLLCWIWFLLKINKSMLYLLLKENYCFSFRVVLQSQFARMTLNSLALSEIHVIQVVRVITANDEVVFVSLGLCLSMDYNRLRRMCREVACSRSCVWGGIQTWQSFRNGALNSRDQIFWAYVNTVIKIGSGTATHS